MNPFLNFQIYVSDTSKVSDTFTLTLFCVLLTPSVFFAQTAHQHARQADKDFAAERYKEAELSYRKAQEQKANDQTAFNLGNSLYKQKRHDEALEHYNRVTEKTTDKALKANSLYNQGNAQFYKKDYQKAVDAYKESLRLNPNDWEAKKNLAVAKRHLDKQKEEEKKKQEQQKNQKNQNQQQNKDQQNQNQQDQQNQQNQNNQQQQQPQNGDKNQPQQPQNGQNQQASPQDLKKGDAKRMLQIMDDEERKVQQRLQKGKPTQSRPTKDW
jgi:Ca-activated chloride channel homolog